MTLYVCQCTAAVGPDATCRCVERPVDRTAAPGAPGSACIDCRAGLHLDPEGKRVGRPSRAKKKVPA